MKKRILILAGGVASRMKKKAEDVSVEAHLLEQADTLTKGMIGVGAAGKSLIDYQLFNAHLANFEEILLLLHPDDTLTQPYYEQQMQQGQVWGMQIRFSRQTIPSGRQKPAGTADAVLQALDQQPDWQQGRLLILNSDNLYSVQALQLLWAVPTNHALISYDRNALEFPQERIKAFAVIRPTPEGYLQEIVEKPDDALIEELLAEFGRVGVSMNAFLVTAEQLLPYLRNTPYHPIRNEKELPTAISQLVAAHPQALTCIPLSENVPDLTSKQDLAVVQAYLRTHYAN